MKKERNHTFFVYIMKYFIDDNLTPLSTEELTEELQHVSDQRKGKVMKFRFESGKMQSLRAYQLLQKLLREEYGITTPPVFKELENGKPVIIGHEDIHFNLSHCKHAVACAVSDKPIGIDIERVNDKLNESLIKYVFSEREQEMILNASGLSKEGLLQTPQIMFTQLWTKKEALVKLTGRGISGKEQLVPILEDWHNGTSDYDFITKQSTDNRWICSICYRKEDIRKD